jgi:hypothetical protein
MIFERIPGREKRILNKMIGINIIFSVFFVISLGYGYVVSRVYYIYIYGNYIGKCFGINNEIFQSVLIIIISIVNISIALKGN